MSMEQKLASRWSSAAPSVSVQKIDAHSGKSSAAWSTAHPASNDNWAPSQRIGSLQEKLLFCTSQCPYALEARAKNPLYATLDESEAELGKAIISPKGGNV